LPVECRRAVSVLFPGKVVADDGQGALVESETRRLAVK